MAIPLRNFAGKLAEQMLVFCLVATLWFSVALGAVTFQAGATGVSNLLISLGESEVEEQPPQKPKGVVIPDDLSREGRRHAPYAEHRNLPLLL